MTKPQEMLQRFRENGVELYREAYKRGMSLSAFLEWDEPSAGYNDGLDAFGRLLKVAGIRVRSLPELGVYADKMETLLDHPDARALAPELLARFWRRVIHGHSTNTRALYTSADSGVGSVERPYIDAAQARVDRMRAPAIPIGELVALTTPIQGGDLYRALYLETTDTEQLRMKRVSEGGEVPKAKLKSGQRETPIYKYGRALEMTYEQLRRSRIDKVQFHIEQLAVQAEVDKVSTIIAILVAGDGNPGTAPEAFSTTTLDPAAAAGAVTLIAWLSYKLKFPNPYALTTVLAREGNALKLLTINTGSANVPLVMIQAAAGFGGFTPINPGLADNVRLGWVPDAPASAIVGFDSRYAIERITEIGSNITEIERFVTRQAQEIVMTESEGYAVLDPNAIKVLNIA